MIPSPYQLPQDPAMESLMRRCEEERKRCDAAGFLLPVHLDLAAALAIIGNLQLAMRHPANTGPSTQLARAAIDGMIRRMIESGLTAHAELAKLGDHEEFDV